MWRVHRLDHISAKKPAKLLDSKSLTLGFSRKQIWPVFLPVADILLGSTCQILPNGVAASWLVARTDEAAQRGDYSPLRDQGGPGDQNTSFVTTAGPTYESPTMQSEVQAAFPRTPLWKGGCRAFPSKPEAGLQVGCREEWSPASTKAGTI